jgi:fatty-acyl-CoA synthase
MNRFNIGGTVGGMIISSIVRHRDCPAIADDFTAWTYAELGSAIGKIMAALERLGLKKGSGVAVLSTNRVEN